MVDLSANFSEEACLLGATDLTELNKLKNLTAPKKTYFSYVLNECDRITGNPPESRRDPGKSEAAGNKGADLVRPGISRIGTFYKYSQKTVP